MGKMFWEIGMYWIGGNRRKEQRRDEFQEETTRILKEILQEVAIMKHTQIDRDEVAKIAEHVILRFHHEKQMRP